MSERAVDRVQRFMLMVPWLSANPGTSVAEAARNFGVSPEQMSRDLYELNNLEIPGLFYEGMLDISISPGVNGPGSGVIRIGNSQSLNLPTRLTTEQATHLILAIDAVTAVVGESGGVFDSAREKLAALLPDAQSAITVAVTDSHAHETRQLSVLTHAIESRSRVRVTYAAELDTSPSIRVIEPLRARFEANLAWVRAWCQKSNAMRTFRSDRVISAEIVDLPSCIPDGLDVAEGIAIFDPFAVNVSADVVAGSDWVFDGLSDLQSHRREDGSTKINFTVASVEWAIVWALRHGEHVTLTAPDHAVAEVRHRAAEALSLEGFRS